MRTSGWVAPSKNPSQGWVAGRIPKNVEYFLLIFLGGQIEEYLMIINFFPTHFRVENLMVKFIFPEKNYFDIFGTKHTFLNVSFFGLKSN